MKTHVRRPIEPDFDDEPTAADLAAIEREMPLIEAEAALVVAEARVLTAEPGPSEVDWARVRSAERAVAREWIAFHTTGQVSTVSGLGRVA
jgi:hypothetical protein